MIAYTLCKLLFRAHQNCASAHFYAICVHYSSVYEHKQLTLNAEHISFIIIYLFFTKYYILFFTNVLDTEGDYSITGSVHSIPG